MTTIKQRYRQGSRGDRPTPMTEVTCIFCKHAEKQIAVWDGEKKETVDKDGVVTDVQNWTWLPRSQVRTDAVDDLADLVEGRVYMFHLPEWLAKDRGLI